MDVTNTPPRVELSVSPARAEIREATGDMTGRAETKNPVTEADAIASPVAAQRDGIEPLDLFQVGDNDDIPLPPEPPRPPLALLALDPIDVPAAEPSEAGPAETVPVDEVSERTPTDQPNETRTTEITSGAPNAATIEAYQSAPPELVEPTVDIRR